MTELERKLVAATAAQQDAALPNVRQPQAAIRGMVGKKKE
tara:strand:- start:324 stop:443 length:120 start_codon:yes stop_codon:yes gene_type:complete